MIRGAVFFCLFAVPCLAHITQLRSLAPGTALAAAPDAKKKDIPMHLSACNAMSPEHVAHLAGGPAKVIVTGKDVKGEVDITDACHAFTFEQHEWYPEQDAPSFHAGSYLEFHTVFQGKKKLITQYNLWGPAFEPNIVI